jgi:hypothetical protein
MSWGARNGTPSTVLSDREVRLAARFRVFLYPAAGTVRLLRIIRAFPTVHNPASSAIRMYSQPYEHCNIDTTDTQKLLLHVLALPWCHHQGVFTVVNVMLSKWFVVKSTVTHLRARTQRYQDCTTHVWVARWPLDDCWLYSEDRCTQSQPTRSPKNILSGFSCVLIEMLIGVQVCDSAAYCGPFQKHYFNNCWEDFLRMAPRECRNTQMEIQCICCVCLYIADCYSMQWHGCLVCTGLCWPGMTSLYLTDWLWLFNLRY